jgi:hypothetical protein
MARFYLHLFNGGGVVEDEEGTELADLRPPGRRRWKA